MLLIVAGVRRRLEQKLDLMPKADRSSDGLSCSPDVWTCGGDNDSWA